MTMSRSFRRTAASVSVVDSTSVLEWSTFSEVAKSVCFSFGNGLSASRGDFDITTVEILEKPRAHFRETPLSRYLASFRLGNQYIECYGRWKKAYQSKESQ